MQRRQFLAQAVATGMVLQERGGVVPDEALLTSVVPSTGERIPRLGLGTWQGFDVGGDDSRRQQLAEVLRVFVAAGGRVVDTSPMYGTAESVLGDLAAEGLLRDKLWLATKVWTSGVEAGVRQMETSLGLLRTSRVELMQVHNLVDWRIHLRTLRTWKDQGRVKYIGVTHYQAGAFDDVARVLQNERLDFVQLNLSLDEPQAADRMLGLCAERGVAFIANRPFGGGGAVARARGKALPVWAMEYDVTTWAQFLLKWVLSHEEVTCAIPGTSRSQHMLDNLDGARGRLPRVMDRARMASHWRAL